MTNSVDILIEELLRPTRKEARQRSYYLAIPHTETYDNMRTRNYVSYRVIKAINLAEATEEAYNGVNGSCFSARLRRDISAWSVDRDKIRPATPQERKRYFPDSKAA
jgi:hypothetical protein